MNNKLKEVRGKIPAQTVADACGISISAYRKYEQKKREPRDSTKLALANYFNVPIYELFFW